MKDSQVDFVLLLCLFFSLSTTSSSIDVSVGVIFNEVSFILDTLHFKPAVDIAVENVNKDVEAGKYLNFTLSYIYRVTNPTCGDPHMIAPGIASELYYDHKVAAFFGPLCSPETEPVGDLASFWNLPVVSGVSTASYLDDKVRQNTLTRTSYKASNVADFMAEVFRKYKWQRCSVIWDNTKSYWTTVMMPSLKDSFEQVGITFYDFILNDFETPMDAMDAAVKKGRSKIFSSLPHSFFLKSVHLSLDVPFLF